ncbi:MAG: hypothetical protein JOZ78_13140 [Chroococcidiopsidaceae cyanobacterium CP_BM_ER_R8_30]|nr:hypothetical protein [Chroococcidiopsidaceae cyanobacterium CP_BM_ER_R8_30]
MPKTQFISRAIALGILSFVMTTLAAQIVQAAKRPVPLLHNTCVTIPSGSLYRRTDTISIGREIYKSLFYLYPVNGSASVTCKIVPDNSLPMFQTLRLGFGMSDSDSSSPSIAVNVYLNGQRTVSKIVSPGQATSLSLNVSNVTDVSIESVCSSQGQQSCGQLYFFNALLEPKTPLGQKK